MTTSAGGMRKAKTVLNIGLTSNTKHLGYSTVCAYKGQTIEWMEWHEADMFACLVCFTCSLYADQMILLELNRQMTT